MKANARQDKNSKTSLMAPAAGKIVESVVSILPFFGISKLEIKKISSANFERLVAHADFFEGTPNDIASCGILVKDSIANILAATGVVELSIEPENGELAGLVEGFKKLIELRDEAMTKTDDSCDDKCCESKTCVSKDQNKSEAPEAGIVNVVTDPPKNVKKTVKTRRKK